MMTPTLGSSFYHSLLARFLLRQGTRTTGSAAATHPPRLHHPPRLRPRSRPRPPLFAPSGGLRALFLHISLTRALTLTSSAASRTTFKSRSIISSFVISLILTSSQIFLQIHRPQSKRPPTLCSSFSSCACR